MGALVASPLYDDAHETMGVLILTWSDAKVFDEADRNVVETLSRLCGQAIVRSQLAGHTTAMAGLAASMAAARTTTEVARLLREHGTTHFGAIIANLRLIDRETATLLPVLPSALPDEVSRRYERLSLRAALAAHGCGPRQRARVAAGAGRLPQALPRDGPGGGGQRSGGVGRRSAPRQRRHAWWPPSRSPGRTRCGSRAASGAGCSRCATSPPRPSSASASTRRSTRSWRRCSASSSRPLPEAAGLELAAFYEPRGRRRRHGRRLVRGDRAGGRVPRSDHR